MSDAAEQAPRRQQAIRQRLEDALEVVTMAVVDESHLHVGHAGARDGRGHFRLQITAKDFAGLPLIRRHRLVYDALGTLMQTDIHALTIEAHAPDEQVDPE
jgi:BolA family transcriptional regulator, general stress-responsive regulator